jgi:hypothetical protein
MIKQLLKCGLTIISSILLSILLMRSIDLFMINFIEVKISNALIQSLYSVFIMIGVALSIFIMGHNRFFED